MLNMEELWRRVELLDSKLAEIDGSTNDPEVFFDLLLSERSVVSLLFAAHDERQWLKNQPIYQKIEAAYLAKKQNPEQPGRVTLRVITVRLPRIEHIRLRRDAANNGISLNELCVNRLLGKDSAS